MVGDHSKYQNKKQRINTQCLPVQPVCQYISQDMSVCIPLLQQAKHLTSPVTRCFPSPEKAKQVSVFLEALNIWDCLPFLGLYSTTTHLCNEKQCLITKQEHKKKTL